MEKKFATIIHTTYELLDFFPTGDPLTMKAKQKALAILDNLIVLENNHGDVEKARAELLVDIAVLEHYLELGKHQGWLGGFNVLILLKEYDGLKEEIKRIKIVSMPMLKVAETTVPKVPPLDKLSARQSTILKILEKKEKTQVADILREIPSVTKRTLRRDLDDLLKKRKIERVGAWNQASYKLGQS